MVLSMRRISVIVICLLLVAAAMPLAASANSVPDIVFSDAWFGNIGRKIEAAPGDKNAQLVVELINTMDKDIRYAQGTLYLPEGFRDSKSGERLTSPSTSDHVGSGEHFYLTFLLDVGEEVRVGEYEASLALRYVEWDEDSISLTIVKVRFRVTGKADLGLSISPSILEPGSQADLKLTVENAGSAHASSAEIWVRSASAGLALLEGGGRHVVGNLAPGSSTIIPLRVFVSRALADGSASLVAEVRYQNSYGEQVIETHELMVKVKPLGGVGVLLDVLIDDPVMEPAHSKTLNIIVKNSGSEAARDVNVEIGLNKLASPPLTVLSGLTSLKLGDLEPGSEGKISIDVLVNERVAGGSYSIPALITYADDEGRHVVEKGLTITILEESRRNKLRVYSDEHVRGGMIEPINITIENIAGERLRDITLTIAPTAGWVTLIGPTTWNIPELREGEKTTLSLKVYAPSETTSGSTIGEPFNLRVEANFKESGGWIRSEDHLIGMYVKGIIDIKLQEISLERMGKDLLLIGKILNEGTEKASYTRIEIVGGDLVSTQVSYLGDVEPNAPILFNIPVERVEKEEGGAKVVLRVSYLDSLRNKGEAILEGVVEMPQLVESSAREQAPQIQLSQLTLIIAIIILLVIIVYLARRRRRVEAG
jgi:hypothetical protein